MNLDEMLSQPLPEVPDNGFSARVIVRVKREERVKAVAIVIAAVAAVTLLCLLVPMPAFTATIGVAVLKFGMSPFAALAAGTLVLTFLADRLWSERGLLQF
jgi:preprotein translocase subunit SecY